MMKKKQKAEKQYKRLREIHQQLKVMSEQTKVAMRNINSVKQTSKEVIKSLRRVKILKIDMVPDKELQIKQLKIPLGMKNILVEEIQRKNNKNERTVTNEIKTPRSPSRYEKKIQGKKYSNQKKMYFKFKEKKLKNQMQKRTKVLKQMERPDKEKAEMVKHNYTVKEVKLNLESGL